MAEPRAIHNLPLTVRAAEVRRLLGYPHDREPPPRVASLIAPLIGEARRLAQGRGVWERLLTSRASELGLEPVEAKALAIGLVTAGPAIEERASDLVARGEETAALILDAAGSAAAEEAADRLSAIIAGGSETAAASPTASCRLSPGYPPWSIDCQEALFRILPGADLGVELLPSQLMVPRKSVSFAMWLGPAAAVRHELGGCGRCHMEHCRYRRQRVGDRRKGDEQ